MKTPNNLDKYIIQLIEQLRTSAQNLPDPKVITGFDENELPEELKMFADVERFLHGESKPLSYIVSIDKGLLPDVNLLSEEQLLLLYDEIEKMLIAFSFFLDFPENLPIKEKYRVLRDQWDKEVVYIGSGHNYLEFCHYFPEECPFPEGYCSCKDFDFDIDIDDSDLENPDFPF